MSRILHRHVARPPDRAVAGDGIMLTLADGRQVIDASGGAAVACLGHGNQRVIAAMTAQAQRLDYVHSAFVTSDAAEALADRLLEGEPGGLSHAFFVSSGSEAMEAALKLARQYALETGQPQRTHVIARWHGYHGNTLGALAASGHVARRAPYEPMLAPGFSRVSPCFAYRHQRPEETSAAYVARLAAELDTEFRRVGGENVIAFCAETMVGATTGCVTAVPGYFAAVREVCDRHGALLILDEVMCGMGRTGSTHAWQQEGVTPDIQTIAKGLGGGYQPIGGLLIARRVIDALRRGSGTFAHGQTYQAHPVACAAALEVQRIIAEEDLLENVRTMGTVLAAALAARFGRHPHVGDIRGRGLFQALEFVADRDTKRCFEPALRLNERVKQAAFDLGLAIYPSGGTSDGTRGDHLIIAPPFVVTADQVEAIVERLGHAVDAALRDVVRQS